MRGARTPAAHNAHKRYLTRKTANICTVNNFVGGVIESNISRIDGSVHDFNQHNARDVLVYFLLLLVCWDTWKSCRNAVVAVLVSAAAG